MRSWALLLSSLEHLKGFAKTNTVRLGSVIPVWAEVEQKSHQPLLLLMDECVAAFAPELHPGSQVLPIVGNKGWEWKFKFNLSITAVGGSMPFLISRYLCRCVLEGTGGSAKFFRGNRTSEIVLSVYPFNLPAGVEVSWWSCAMQNVVFLKKKSLAFQQNVPSQPNTAVSCHSLWHWWGAKPGVGSALWDHLVKHHVYHKACEQSLPYAFLF